MGNNTGMLTPAIVSEAATFYLFPTTIFVVDIAVIEGAGGADGFEPLQVSPSRASRRRNHYRHAVRQGPDTSNRPLAQAHPRQVQPLLVYPHLALCSILLMIYYILLVSKIDQCCHFRRYFSSNSCARFPVSVYLLSC